VVALKVQRMNVGQTIEIKVKDKDGNLKEHRLVRNPKDGVKTEENLMEV